MCSSFFNAIHAAVTSFILNDDAGAVQMPWLVALEGDLLGVDQARDH